METKSTCPYCGVGCGVIIESDAGGITGVRGDPDHPANFGKLCSKGATLHLTLNPRARATAPMLRANKTARREAVTWATAIETAAAKFAATIREYGPDSVAFYISGQLLTEDYYVFNKLAKGLIGTNNVDTNSRLCMSSAVAGYKATLGADAPPCAYEDIDHATCIFIAGSNTAYAHPILFRRIEAARRANPNLKLIVADPRRTETASEADIFLQIKPGSDVALFNAMLHVMVRDRLVDRDYIAAHTEGFAALETTLANYAPESAAAAIGISAERIVEVAHLFAASSATLSLYCQGLNQSVHGTDKNAALINLHLATRQIGKPGAGPFSLTGQPNAMGGREVGGLANLLSAHRDLANPAHRDEVAALWGVPSVPATPGKTAVELFDAMHRGDVKCVWIACTNPAQSMPNQRLVRAALECANFVVLQDCYSDTETAPYADLVLPASTWGEKEGTVTNSERRISRVRAAIAPPGEARHDWQIAADFARALAEKMHRADGARLFPYQSAEEVFNEHRETTRGRDLDMTGLSYATLEQDGPQQWPYLPGATAGKTRLYADGRFPTQSGRAMFANTRHLPLAEPVSAAFPYSLNTGRLRDQWHSMARTGRAPQLHAHAPEPVLTMHPQTLRALGCRDHDFVRVNTVRGALTLPIVSSEDVALDGAFLPMHWGSRFLKGDGVNTLTTPQFDPRSKQPELKHAAINVTPVALPWPLLAMGRVDNPDAVLAKLAAEFPHFEYASCGLTGSSTDGSSIVTFRAAHTLAADAAALMRIDALLGLDAGAAAFSDNVAGTMRMVSFADNGIVAFRLAGDITGGDFLRECVESGANVRASGYRLLAPDAAAAMHVVPRGRVVCSCHNVAENDINACFAVGNSLAVVQSQLRCGTGCGSCVPELKRLAITHTTAEALAA
jgi:assimilatory nitrate reductase catalytic subunit